MKKCALIVIFLTAFILSSCTENRTASTTVGDPPILMAYKKRLIENIYRYRNNRPDTLPTYALFDFDSDGTAELIVWGKRTSSASYRDIYVYRFNPITGKADHIGTMTDFSGHSRITCGKDGIIIAIGGSERDRITRYAYLDGRLIPDIVAERTDESSQKWNKIMEDYSDGVSLETAETYDKVEKEFREKLF